MSEERIKRKELWASIGNIKRNQNWFKAAETLGFVVTQSRGGTSHYVIREKDADPKDIRTVITTIASHGNLRQDVNREIFKSFLNHGVQEDDIWKALEMLDKDALPLDD